MTSKAGAFFLKRYYASQFLDALTAESPQLIEALIKQGASVNHVYHDVSMTVVIQLGKHNKIVVYHKIAIVVSNVRFLSSTVFYFFYHMEHEKHSWSEVIEVFSYVQVLL